MIHIEITNEVDLVFWEYLKKNKVKKMAKNFRKLAKKMPKAAKALDRNDYICITLLPKIDEIGEIVWDFLKYTNYQNNEQAQAKQAVHETIAALNACYVIVDPYSYIGHTLRDHSLEVVLENFRISQDNLFEIDHESLEDLRGNDLLVYDNNEKEEMNS